MFDQLGDALIVGLGVGVVAGVAVGLGAGYHTIPSWARRLLGPIAFALVVLLVAEHVDWVHDRLGTGSSWQKAGLFVLLVIVGSQLRLPIERLLNALSWDRWK